MRRTRVLVPLIAALGLAVFPAVSQAWDGYEAEAWKDCLAQAQPGADFDCLVPVKNTWPKSHPKGWHDFFIVGFKDIPDPGLTCVPQKQSGSKGQEIARIAPDVTPSIMLVGGAKTIHVFKVTCHVDANVKSGTVLCNKAFVLVTNHEDKPKWIPVKDCILIVVPPVVQPPPVVALPPAAQPPAPPVVTPPVVQPPAPKPTPKPRPCKPKTIEYNLYQNVFNDDGPGAYRRSSADKAKRCHYPSLRLNLDLECDPKRAKVNPDAPIRCEITNDKPRLINILYTRYFLDGERRGSWKRHDPFGIKFLSRTFGAMHEPLNEWKRLRANGKVRLQPITDYPTTKRPRAATRATRT